MSEITNFRGETLAPQSGTRGDAAVDALILRVGERVRKARELKGIPRRVLSDMSGVSPRYLALLEAGEGNISIGLLQRVAEALDHRIEWLVGEDDPWTSDALRMAAGAVDLGLPATNEPLATARPILARLPTLVAAYWRMKQGQEPVAPNPALSHAANYLYMLTGAEPDAAQVRGLETYLNTVVDHGLNASTFAARVIIATETDLVSAVVGAIGALKGPRHGGAPGPALDMVFDIGEAERAEPYLRAKLERKELLMGFGHRVYKVRDPRAEVLAQAAEKMYRASGDMALYELAKHVEKTAVALLAEYKPGRNLQTNVEFYTALLLHGLELDTELFTPTFAISRAAGWIAHCFEQQAAGRIIRPESKYVGEVGLKWGEVAQV